MDRDFFIELTNDLYRLTILFPKEEPIRIKIRSLADDVLTALITILDGDSEERVEAAKTAERDIGILESLLEIAQDQKWVKEEEFKEIVQSYAAIREELEEFNKLRKGKKSKSNVLEERKTEKKEKSPGRKISALNSRQKKILEILEKNDKVQVKDVIDKLDEDVTKRTIRRDFKKLINLDFAERVGRANMAGYKLKD